MNNVLLFLRGLRAYRRLRVSALYFWLSVVFLSTSAPAWAAYTTTLSVLTADDPVLIQGSNGTMYAALEYGGSETQGTACESNGCGYIISISPSGVVTFIHSFSGGTDGINPTSLILGSDGNLYGTTRGWPATGNIPGAPSTVFKVSPTTGAFTTLVTSPVGPDGQSPVVLSNVVEGSDSNFYFVSGANGPSPCSNSSYQSLCRTTSSGAVSQIAVFTQCGPNLLDNQILAGSDGNLYGAGLSSNQTWCFFQATLTGTITLLASTSIPQQDNVSLAFESNGLIYGVDDGGPPSGGWNGAGDIFTLTPTGTLTTLYSFSGTGYAPQALPLSLTLGSDGNIYGETLTYLHGGFGGTAYELTTGGAASTLFTFSGYAGYPGTGPIVTNSGVTTIYGLTDAYREVSSTSGLPVVAFYSLNLGSSTGADVSLTGTGSETTAGVLTYNLTIANAGPLSSTGTLAVDVIPPNATLVTSSSSSSCSQLTVGQGTQSGTLLCNFGTLASGQSTPFTVTLDLTPPATFNASWQASSAISDPNVSNNSLSVSVGPPTADLSISGSAKGTQASGVTYNVTVANSGPDEGQGVTVTLSVSSGTTLAAGSSSSCAQSGNTITCTVGTIAVNGTTPLTVILDGSGDASATFAVNTSADYNPNTTTNTVELGLTPSTVSEDSPLPPWAYLLLACGLLLVAQRRLKPLS